MDSRRSLLCPNTIRFYLRGNLGGNVGVHYFLCSYCGIRASLGRFIPLLVIFVHGADDFAEGMLDHYKLDSLVL